MRRRERKKEGGARPRALGVGHLGVEGGERAHHAAEDGHGVRVVAEAAVELDELLVHQRVHLDLALKGGLLGLREGGGWMGGGGGDGGHAALRCERAGGVTRPPLRALTLLGSSPCSSTKVESRKSPSEASSSMGYPRYSSTPLLPSM